MQNYYLTVQKQTVQIVVNLPSLLQFVFIKIYLILIRVGRNKTIHIQSKSKYFLVLIISYFLKKKFYLIFLLDLVIKEIKMDLKTCKSYVSSLKSYVSRVNFYKNYLNLLNNLSANPFLQLPIFINHINKLYLAFNFIHFI